MTIRTIRARRAGFTLVELLVVMALVTLIMAILSEAFAQSLNTFRHMKALGDLHENMRKAVVPLRNDLLQRHFDGTEKLSVSYAAKQKDRPTRGFFRIESLSSQVEVADPAAADFVGSSRAENHILHMSTAIVGSRRADWHTAAAPGITSPADPTTDPSRWLWLEGPSDYREGGVVLPGSNPTAYSPNQRGFMNSQWSEVMWFLAPMIDPDTGTQMTAGDKGIRLFNLYRRHRLMVVDNFTQVNTNEPIANVHYGLFPEIACKPNAASGNLTFCSPTDSSDPSKRSMMAPDVNGNYVCVKQPTSDHRVIADVVSFEVRVLLNGSFKFETIEEAQARLRTVYPDNVNNSWVGIPTNIYDTHHWPKNNATAPDAAIEDLRITIKAVQIIIRVWDDRTSQTRQVTLMQDM